MQGRVRLTGRDLDLESVVAVARSAATVEVEADARARIEAASAAVQRAVERGTPIYGVTTGLGPRVEHPIDPGDSAAVALRTLRGRATAVGEPLPDDVVRAAMLVRLNGLCAGGAGAGIAVADGIAALLNRGVHPVIPRIGSVGAGDICLLAFVGLVLVGESSAEFGGVRIPAAEALRRAGLQPIDRLGPKDGLAILSSSAVSAGAAALALADGGQLVRAAQVAAALSMEGFRANLSPLNPRAVAARPAPGQEWSATGLRALLAGGSLTEPGAARRLQDPLSFRVVAAVHGSLDTALRWLEEALGPELNGAPDNPLVLASDDAVIPTGNFHVPVVSLALDAVAIAVAQVAALANERRARLMSERLSGLPDNLTRHGASRSGFAALEKSSQALTEEIRRRAAPLALQRSVGAAGVEDDSTNAVAAAVRLREQLEDLRLLVAVELVTAAQAVDLAAPERLGAGTARAHALVRELVPALDEDRPLGPDIELIAAEAVSNGRLLAAVGEAGA
jgi:histidine ammonia-lyase